jgi:DNA-binding MarR family transcriptional regulator
MYGGYSICLNKWALDQDIKNELGLLLIISSLTAEKGYCFASNQRLAEIFETTEVSISRKLKKLVEKGYINIEYKKKGCQVINRKIRLTKMLTDDYQKCYSTINKNVKDNNTSILILNNNNISEQSMALSEYFCSQLEKNGLKPRSEQTKSIYAKTFDSLLQTYSENSLVDIIKFATTNNFWKGICLSASKVKQHAEQLYIQMAGRTNPALDCDRVTDTNVDF